MSRSRRTLSLLDTVLFAAVLLLLTARAVAHLGAEATLTMEQVRRAWPELAGRGVEDAVETIKRERPDVDVIVVPHNAMVTMDYREKRVRIYERDGVVAKEPRVG